ncbi:hypothetical protein B5F37_05535 [Drancourtella sp. An210]|nr:hypothetical protein [uncultured Sellimonas sp.]OUP01958.1 hypothetical protein B5F37_05535 [Drancourtella sp. An210]
MYAQTRSIDIIEFLPIFFSVLIGMLIILFIIYYFLKRADNNKELITKKVKVIEKPVHQGNIAWYVVECENGERIKLRSFDANTLLISVGDIGILKYKGQTIQSFVRQ